MTLDKGRDIYNRYLDELEYSETLGFDGICVNEHHQNTYGTMPSPNIIGALLARRTNRVKIAMVGNGLPLRDHPIRVAEEIAMLDVVSGGRIISGFVRGIGCEYYSMGVNPTHSIARFREAHDLIIRAWTETGPFNFDGEHYQVRYVNVWPRPYQKPHPQIWIPGFGSKETMGWCADPARKYPYLAGYMSDDLVKMYFDQYRRRGGRVRVYRLALPDGPFTAHLCGGNRRPRAGRSRGACAVALSQRAAHPAQYALPTGLCHPSIHAAYSQYCGRVGLCEYVF